MKLSTTVCLLTCWLFAIAASAFAAESNVPERLAAHYYAKLREGDMASVARCMDAEDLSLLKEKLTPVFDAGFFASLPPEALQVLTQGDRLTTVRDYPPEKLFERFIELIRFPRRRSGVWPEKVWGTGLPRMATFPSYVRPSLLRPPRGRITRPASCRHRPTPSPCRNGSGSAGHLDVVLGKVHGTAEIGVVLGKARDVVCSRQPKSASKLCVRPLSHQDHAVHSGSAQPRPPRTILKQCLIMGAGGNLR